MRDVQIVELVDNALAARPDAATAEYDVFISHASEVKDAVARPGVKCPPVDLEAPPDDGRERKRSMNKVLHRDTIPYDTPSSLHALRGPSNGVVELPLSVHWGPQHTYDLDDPSDLESAYQALVREGTTDLQEELLNERLLRGAWRDLVLPARCRLVWESRFPELVG